MYSKLKVLLLVAEFPFWRHARHLSYSAQLGIEEGLRASGVECLTVPSLWFPKALKLCNKRKFDHVWVVGRLDIFDQATIESLPRIAPVRVGMVAECFEYDESECRISPTLKTRSEKLRTRLQYLTHIAACDEKDVEDLNKRRGIPAIWWPQAVPERFISDDVAPPSVDRAVFYGASYGLRLDWLRRADVKRVLAHPRSPENGTVYPLLFNSLHLPLHWPFRGAVSGRDRLLAEYLPRWRHVRERCFESWLKALQRGAAVVNLPHFVRTYAGRVVEGMAAGRPVISWEIPGRARNRALFEAEQEILLYSGDDPGELTSQIDRILSDTALSRRITVNARRKLRRFHTTETRVQQILDWVAEGRVPSYS